MGTYIIQKPRKIMKNLIIYFLLCTMFIVKGVEFAEDIYYADNLYPEARERISKEFYENIETAIEYNASDLNTYIAQQTEMYPFLSEDFKKNMSQSFIDPL